MTSLYPDHVRKLRGLDDAAAYAVNPGRSHTGPGPFAPGNTSALQTQRTVAGPGGAAIPAPQGAVALTDTGLPIGSTGGLVPEQGSERDARMRALEDAAAEAVTLNSQSAQKSQPAVRRIAPGTSSLAMSQLLGVNPALPDGAGRRSQACDTGSSVLNNAMALEQLGATLTASREARLMETAGAGLPTDIDPPEIQQRKLTNLRQRLVNDDLGVENRSPGSPVYLGGQPGEAFETARLDLTGSDQRMTRDRAAHLAEMGRFAIEDAMKPKLVNLGKTSSGRPVEGVTDRTGNFRLVGDEKEPKGTQLAQLIAERDQWRAAGRDDLVAEYDRVIANFGARGDDSTAAALEKFAVEGGGALQSQPTVVSRPANAVAPGVGAGAYSSADEVKQAVMSGKITRAAGIEILKSEFGMN
jgi:hypothetical protein